MDWHQRYTQQARWTRDLRSYLFRQVELRPVSQVLEIGCGTGAILSELPESIAAHGIDIDRAGLVQSHLNAPAAMLVQGDALALPYRDKSFDILYCHFLLLWVHDPLQALLEMKRAAKPGGHILAFAEPDYSARVDEPGELVPLGEWQTEALRRQGADPGLGARLADLFFRAGIRIVETGPIQNAGDAPSARDWATEWTVIESDLAGFVPDADIRNMKRLDQGARERGERVLHVPTYFAWGQA
jgi:SAM-dependent methyltransferase